MQLCMANVIYSFLNPNVASPVANYACSRDLFFTRPTMVYSQNLGTLEIYWTIIFSYEIRKKST
jgi:hypothetical protein